MSWVCIDFGTCNTAAAIEIDGVPHIVSYGNQQFFPTIACIFEDGTMEVCQNAEPYRQSNPETFKQEFKLSIADALDINSTTYENIVAEILSFVKGCSELENNGKIIDNVILTVPAIYTENDKRKAVMASSAEKAGFKKIEFLSEPQAAAMHYAQITGDKNVGLSLIYDLGGGTFDPALLEISDKSAKLIGHETGVKCGGQYFDRAIFNYISESAKEENKPLDRRGKLDDYAACRRIKEALSIKEMATQLFSNGVRYTLDRAKFNELIKDYIELTLQACDKMFATSRKKWTELKQILLVGGSTAIPLITEMLHKHLISHNASAVKIIRNAKGEKGQYNNRFATCLGGISGKILPPPEKIATIVVAGRNIQLNVGDNNFGRDTTMDFQFNDPTMSRHHFTITVTKGADNRYSYVLTTKSQTRATIVNNMEALDCRYAPFSRISLELQDGFTILAGKTKFVLEKGIIPRETSKFQQSESTKEEDVTDPGAHYHRDYFKSPFDT